MRIVVCMKQVYAPETVKISRSREELDLREATRITNPPDKLALEWALRLREALGGEVIALMVEAVQAEDVLREAIAMGADRSVLVTGLDPAVAGGRAVAKAIAAVIRRTGAVDLVLTGQSGLIDGAGSLAPRVAAELGWPVVLDTVRLAGEAGGQVRAAVVTDAGAWRMPLTPPMVVAVASGPDPIRPRYPIPARIANAWQPGLVEIWSPEELELDRETLAPDIEPGALVLPPERSRGQIIGGPIVEAAEQLVALLETKGFR